MTVMGASKYGPQGVQTVDSVDVWVPLLTLDSDDLPDQGAAQDYVFVIWGDFGNFNTLNNPGVISATAEITIGDQNAPISNVRDTTRSLLVYPQLSVGGVPGRTIPFFHVYGRTSSIRGAWDTTTRDFTIWARIAANTDPFVEVAGATFTVGNLGIMAFSLANLTSTTMLHDRYTPGTPPQGNGSTPATYQTTSAPWNAGAGTWLTMFSTSHAPWPYTTRSQVNADRIVNYYVAVPPSTGVTRLTAYGATGTDGRHGMSERLPYNWPLQGIWGSRALYLEGGFRVLETPTTTAELGVSLLAPGATSGVLSGALVQWEVFAIRVDTGGGEGLGDFEYVQKNAGTTPGSTIVDDIFNGVGVAYGSETREEQTFGSSTKTRQANLHVQVAPWANGLEANQSWQLRVEEPGYNGNLYNQVIPFIEANRLGDSPMFRAGGLIPPGSGVGIDYDFFLIQNVSEGLVGALTKRAESFLAFAFGWENNPQNVTATIPAVPAAVSIVPGRESPNVSALNALPNGAGGDQLLPDIEIEWETEKVREEFEPDDLIKLTWPAFMAARRKFSLRWDGLSIADRDTLLAFFAAQSGRIWKLALPEDPATYLAVVQTENPRTQDVGVQHSVRLSVAELIFTS